MNNAQNARARLAAHGGVHIGLGVFVVSSTYWGGGMTRVARSLAIGDETAPVASATDIAHIETYWAGLSPTSTPRAILERWPTTSAARTALPLVRRALLAITAARTVQMRGAWHIDAQERALVAAIVGGGAVEIPPLLAAPSEADVEALAQRAARTQIQQHWRDHDAGRAAMWAAMARQDQRDALVAGCAAAGIAAVS